ncbi:DUF5065 domain-containing protein [Bacillus toyonensis]|uniref:DUF5065 family protein n=1 Tax=Bacillus toyonensis TaxID=155322 RepID=UPI000B453704|nr:DUF5065 family protein [Bacillus toyonensis]OTW89172.1 DUF5065 domain-containing protein [Bacillus thuringiensis serovar cameroun]MCU5305467.1 DUF5065 family protein [Bacillus toyonensis]PEJ14320.1 DUF5065 domain-containing protein [Bacillus toyonensis]TBX46496.1 DUF5065 family protein [Bacillus toyonensis]TBX66060.1 DUF5065 family protein [Bacillus toyonensis]
MKKLGKIALAGALAFGGFTAVEILQPSIQAQAAVADDWPYKTFPQLHNLDNNASLNVGNLKQGQTITINEPIGGGDWATVKIYRVMPDMSLARYKTIENTGKGEYEGKFTTTITTAYDPGNYVAVMQYGYESEGNIYYYYTTGNMFTISK